MSSADPGLDPLGEASIISFLVTGGTPEAMVNAEGTIRTTLYASDDDPQPIVAEVRRFAELPEEQQAEWRLAVRRAAED